MPQFNTRHGKREQSFFMHTFPDGLNQELAPAFIPNTALSECKNIKYAFNQAPDGQKFVILKKRQGTEALTTTAHSAAILAATYYIADAQYIIATATTVHELTAGSGTLVPSSSLGTISGIPTFTEFRGKLIIHDSGVTKAWNGTTFETLTCLYTDELIETGDGSTTKFAGTLAKPAVRPGATPYFLTIDFTDTTAKSITDDGNGRLTGNISSAVVINITAATKASPCQITAASHGFSNGDIVNIQSAGGMTEINNLSFTIANVAANTFTIGVDSSAYTTYTSGGTASANAVVYSSGVYTFTADGAPDNTTPVYATYEKVSGAPKSKAGFVRANRLYVWGDSDNPSRLWYTAANDEDAWDSSSGGGYIDIDPLDGYSLVTCINFFSSIIAFKENSIHRIDNFPGDNTFRAVPLVSNSGSIAYKSCLNYGNVITYLSGKQGWIAMQPTDQYGDLSQYIVLSKGFQSLISRWS
ncbi:MAG: ubiquitin-activating E1 FCCH domain-containing protein, partial [Elusimicrobiota bacterium]|nr:ubiquitin-activating E1 FCCH domain-containing protein [Elusimicrobiota bacterium]